MNYFLGFTVYVIELALKMSPFPLSVQRKELSEARSVYQKVIEAMQNGSPKLFELSCELIEGKKMSVLTSEILAIQIYEKTASIGGAKRPGFSFNT